MARLDYVADESTNPLVHAFYEGCRELIGRVPNASRLYARFPKGALWFLPFLVTLQREGAGGLLDGPTKELAILATSVANRCAYCVAHNSSLGRATGLSSEEIAAVEGDERASAVLSERQKAIIVWATAVADNTALRDSEVFETLRRFFNEDEILELTWLCALFNMNNRVHNALWLDVEEQSDIDLIQRSRYVSERSVLEFIRRALRVAEGELAGEETSQGETGREEVAHG